MPRVRFARVGGRHREEGGIEASPGGVRLHRNMFDLLVVSMSLVALGPISMPISVVRLMRAFRQERDRLTD